MTDRKIITVPDTPKLNLSLNLKYYKNLYVSKKKEIDKCTLIDFNTSFLVTDTSKGKKW